MVWLAQVEEAPEKPVGTVWIAYADENGTYTKKLQLTTERILNIKYTANIVMNLIRLQLQGWIQKEKSPSN